MFFVLIKINSCSIQCSINKLFGHVLIENMTDKSSDSLTFEDKLEILEEWIKHHEFLPEIIGNYIILFVQGQL